MTTTQELQQTLQELHKAGKHNELQALCASVIEQTESAYTDFGVVH
jgi:hypothetical protein